VRIKKRHQSALKFCTVKFFVLDRYLADFNLTGLWKYDPARHFCYLGLQRLLPRLDKLKWKFLETSRECQNSKLTFRLLRLRRISVIETFLKYFWNYFFPHIILFRIYISDKILYCFQA